MHNEVEPKSTGRHALLIVLHVRGLLLDYSSLYRLHYEVEVSTGFTHRGPEARNRVETKPSDVTDLYHGLRGPDNVSTA